METIDSNSSHSSFFKQPTKNNKDKLKKLNLPSVETVEDFANLSRLKVDRLRQLTYHTNGSLNDCYNRFNIPKHNGKVRTISSPNTDLRLAQKDLIEFVLNKIPLHDAAIAFRKDRSILDNAKKHENKAIVIRIDLQNFFPSIKYNRIKGFFYNLGYNSNISSFFARLTTEPPLVLDNKGKQKYVIIDERQLPQGASTSPVISNAICYSLDEHLSLLADFFDLTYTRYADDCIFSGNDPNFDLSGFLTAINKVVHREGFIINKEKTKIMKQGQRQMVTGLTVNEKPNIPRSNLRDFRAFLHHCDSEGLQAMSQRIGQNALNYAQGYLAFIYMVNPEKANQYLRKYPWLQERNTSVKKLIADKRKSQKN